MQRARIKIFYIINYDMYKLIVQRQHDYKNRLFALCESCYWTATILTQIENYHCPVCNSHEIALIPLSKNEKYEYNLNSKHGLQIRFSVLENHK